MRAERAWPIHTLGGKMGALDDLLPDPVKRLASRSGNELVLPRDEALQAIEIAKRYQIAVQGVEQFKVQEDGFLVLDYSGYDGDISYLGDWNNYVSELNEQAERWILKHTPELNHGYILTSASKKEFEELEPGPL